MTDRAGDILNALEQGEWPDHAILSTSDASDHIIEELVASPSGRRWLRAWPGVPEQLAGRLLQFEGDFRTNRRDRSLDQVVSKAPVELLLATASLLASSPAAGAFWTKLAHDPPTLIATAAAIVRGRESRPAENTLYLLVLDPINPYNIDDEGRIDIATAALGSAISSVRSLAAEYLFDHEPESLASRWRELVMDRDERIRALGWSAGLRAETGAAFNAAVDLLGNAGEKTSIRRSALAAIGSNFETRDVVDILALYVTHDDHELALDAGNLLFRLHRHPTIAMAAANSPHEDVREIGQFLLDPYRGSPAAGGSRPGDPTNSDVFAEMIRQTEERILDVDPEEGDKP